MDLTTKEILNLLRQLDAGKQLTEAERQALLRVTRLNIHPNEAESLPNSIGALKNLNELWIVNLPIKELPPSIGELENLEVLVVVDNGKKTLRLPDTIQKLKNLRHLGFQAVGNVKLPGSIAGLERLEELRFIHVNNTELPKGIRGLKNLRRVVLYDSGFTTLPEWIGELPALKEIFLGDLTLDAIPRSLAMKGLPFQFGERPDLDSRKPSIFCKNLRLRNQDISIFEAGPEAIRQYYSDAEKRRVRETRLIFLGDGGVGKSYTIKRILNDGAKETKTHPYETHETPGVEIADLSVTLADGPLDLHLWDFGGQEILHSMHRCFLTGRTVYLVMVDSRHEKPTSRARYWLRNVRSFAENAPVLLMLNCWDRDDGEKLLDDYQLQKEFPNLKRIERVNAKFADPEAFRAFRDRLFAFAAESESCGSEIDAGWDRARRRVREKAREKHYLQKEDFYRICGDCGIQEDQRQALRRWFNILGVSFSFQREGEDETAADYQLLDPVWLTNALYAVIKEGSRKAHEGVIRVTAVEDMLFRETPPDTLDGKSYSRPRPELRYNKAECGYILRIAEQFYLAYRISEEEIFFPALCQEKQPPFEAPKRIRRKVSYEMEYDYLPDSVIHQLMVACRKRRDLVLESCWFHGFVLRGFDGLTGVLHMDEDNRTLKLSIYSTGEAKAWSLLAVIHALLREVNERLSMNCKEYIVAERPGSGEKDRFTWKTLLRIWIKSAEKIAYGDNGEYSVEELLGDIYSKERLREFLNAEGLKPDRL